MVGRKPPTAPPSLQVVRPAYQAPTIEGRSLPATLLHAGKEIAGHVKQYCFKYFKISVPHKNIALKLVVHNVSGDPDIFVCNRHANPNQQHYTWKSAGMGSDEVYIPPDDPWAFPGAYYIGVYGAYETDFTILATFIRIRMLVKHPSGLEADDGGSLMRDEIKAADTRRQLCKYGAGFLEQLETPRGLSASSPRPGTPRGAAAARRATAGAMPRHATDDGVSPMGLHGGACPQPPATARPEYTRQSPRDVAQWQHSTPAETTPAADECAAERADALNENDTAISPSARVCSRPSRFSVVAVPLCESPPGSPRSYRVASAHSTRRWPTAVVAGCPSGSGSADASSAPVVVPTVTLDDILGGEPTLAASCARLVSPTLRNGHVSPRASTRTATTLFSSRAEASGHHPQEFPPRTASTVGSARGMGGPRLSRTWKYHSAGAMVGDGERGEQAPAADLGPVSYGTGVQFNLEEYGDEADPGNGADVADDNDGGVVDSPGAAAAATGAPRRDAETRQRRTGSGALLVPEEQKKAILDAMLCEASPRRRWSPEVHSPRAASAKRNAERLANLIRPQAVPVRVRAPGEFEHELRNTVLLPSKIREERLAAEKALKDTAAAALAPPTADSARQTDNKQRRFSSKCSGLYIQDSERSLGGNDVPTSVAAAVAGSPGVQDAITATSREIVADILNKSLHRKSIDLSVGSGDHKSAATTTGAQAAAAKGSARSEGHASLHKAAQKDIATKYGMSLAQFSARIGIPVNELVELERGEFYRLKQLLKAVLEESLDLQDDVRQALYRFRSKTVQHVDSNALCNIGWKEVVAPLVRSETQRIMSVYERAVEEKQAEEQAKEEQKNDLSSSTSQSSRWPGDTAAREISAQVASEGVKALSSDACMPLSVLPTPRSPPLRSSRRGSQNAAASTNARRPPPVVVREDAIH